MFEHLVESTSHKDDLARKGSFVMGTIAVYAVFLTVFFVLGIYMYDAQLDNQSLELTTLVAPVPVPPAENKPAEAAKPQKVITEQNVDVRKELIQNMNESPIPPKEISAKASDIPPRRSNVQTMVGTDNTNAVNASGPIGPGTGTGGGGTGGPIVSMDAPPPPPVVKKTAVVSGGVLNGKAISLPKPPYPQIARTARASGTVTVQVMIDENGSVVSASAVSGHPLLRAAAVQAARQARFTPTKLSGQPVKVSGVINYNFGLQ
jgi:protein TonB